MTKLNNKIGFFIGFAYFCIVLTLEYLLSALKDYYWMSLLIDIPAIFIFIWLLIPKIQKEVNKINIRKSFNNTGLLKVFATFFISEAFLLLLLFICIRPGGFSPDSIEQYKQAISGNYSDWHPVIHTLLFFTLPLKITGLSGSIYIWQAFLFSISLAFLCTIIWKNSTPVYAIGSFIWIALSPFTINIIAYPWKDVGLAIFSGIITAFAIEIHFSNGRCIRNTWIPILLGILLAICTLIRHNGVLFTFPLFLAIMLYGNKKGNFLLILVFIITLLGIKGLLYSTLNVENPQKRTTETAGLPLTIIGNVIVNDPECLDDETKNYIYSISSQDEWEKYYECGNFNSIKFTNIVDTSIVDEKGPVEVLKVTWKCIKAAPKYALDAFITLTDMVYGFRLNSVHQLYGITICENEFGISNQASPVLLHIINAGLSITSYSLLRYVFFSIGFFMAILIICISGKINFKSKDDRKKFWLVIPIFIYNFGTMLLLTGFDLRFFYITVMILPGLLVILLRENKEDIPS